MIDDILEMEVESHPRGGEYALWLRVTRLSVWEFKNKRFNDAAKGFLFDRNNPFFEAVCDGLGYEPEAIRERLRRVVVNDQDRGEGLHRPDGDNVTGGI